VVSRSRRLRASLRKASLPRQDQLDPHASDSEGADSVPGERGGVGEPGRNGLFTRGAFLLPFLLPHVLIYFRLQLLQRDPKKRLGCKQTGGLEGFKRHPWFEGYDWAVFERKEATPPFEPDVRTVPLLYLSNSTDHSS
jgi:hypothetical protein